MDSSMNQEPPSPASHARVVLWLLLAVVLVALVMWRVYWPRTGRERNGSAHPAAGRKLNRLSLQPLTGKAKGVTADDLKGKVTLINYWGPWCGPCRIEFPHLYELRQSLRQQPAAQIVSVSCSVYEGAEDNAPDEIKATEEFLREQNADMPTYFDPFFKSRRPLLETASLREFAYPTTVILDRSGTIRGLWQGYIPGDELAMHRLMKELVAEGT